MFSKEEIKTTGSQIDTAPPYKPSFRQKPESRLPKYSNVDSLDPDFRRDDGVDYDYLLSIGEINARPRE